MQPFGHSNPASVLVLGGSGLDTLARAGSAVVSGDSTPGRVITSSGGVARNVAENLARLGIDARLVSAVGEDISGSQLRAATAQAGVDVRFLQTRPAATTASYVVFADQQGETCQAISDMQIFDSVRFSDYDNLTAQIQASSLCVIDVNFPEDFIAQVAAECANVPLVCDAVSRFKCRRLQGVLDCITLLKLNVIEAAYLLGSASEDPVQLAEQLLDCGVGAVLMSQGADGASYTDASQAIHLPALRVPVTSVNGAGDALLAGLVAARLDGQSCRTQLQWGLRAAAISCQSQLAVATDLNIEQLRSDTN